MGYTSVVLDDIRSQLAPADVVLKEARQRRDIVRRAAESFVGVLKSYGSGSLAHGTANCPIHRRDKGLDADCGVVLDRRVHQSLGPDSEENVGPDRTVAAVLEHLRPKVLTQYPAATFEITKRALFIEFHEPMASGEDPTVDLVVGLRRRDEGLWIPNTEQHRWDPSHPEKHTELLTAEPKSFRVTRARAIRLAKAENKRPGRRPNPPLCSFNLEALALMFVQQGQGVPAALLQLWESGAKDLARRNTPDPAGVSAPIKVSDRDYAVERLTQAAGTLRAALECDDDEYQVRGHLSRLWPDFVAPTPFGETKARVAARLQAGKPLAVTSVGTLAATGSALKQPRSFGARGSMRSARPTGSSD
ncbi:hypothetical protein FEZ60_32110 [Rhodococcus sp. MS16]|uniref:hypothetical protein n=1 Tax=Rhodococcus sp. MS16 TaxID=2579941 RepID=UPI00156213C0|nr:hypothetical protein [Rhodococcus sp. MS16]NRI70146.1 hypothetical protein [Rhodococcus sp. MS16]